MKFLHTVLILLPAVLVQGGFFNSLPNNATHENWISRLYHDKMQGYHKGGRPVKDPNHNTTVSVGLYLTSVHVNDHTQQMKMSAWSIMTWKDEYLSWEPKNYMNIDRIHFDQTDVWTPDIAVYNSAEPAGVVPFVKIPVLVDHLGTVYWFPPTYATVNCDLDISNWPKDQHECLVRVGSWSHHGEQINLQILKHNETTDIMMSDFKENSQWKLLEVKNKVEVINLEGHESYMEINYIFVLQRQAKVHATYIMTSALVVMVVVLVTYALPLTYFFPRLLMHLFAMGICVTCYLTLFSNLPDIGGEVPFVVRYYSGTTVLTLISMISTIFLTTHACCHSNPKSNFGKRVVGFVASAPGLRGVASSQQAYTHLESEMYEDPENPPAQPTSTSTDNKLFSAGQVKRVINFLLFVLFLIAFFVDYAVLRSITK